MTYLSGFHAIEEQIQAGDQNGAMLYVGTPGPRVKRIMALADQHGVNVQRVGQAELDKMAPDNRGAVLALKHKLQDKSVDLDSWLAEPPEKALVLILDHIEDPHNLGAILRSADIFNVDLVIIPERRAARETDTVARVSAGALAYVPLARVPNLARALEQLKENDFWAYAADMQGSKLPSVKFTKRTVLVMGAEGKGVSRLLQEHCDETVAIPQGGHVESLNVSVATGIFLYAIRNQR
ncbi:MAG: 23S rRNA (guanosine(2251)-2'-O)-methyltransferase RlmB [Spirochaetes bacterium GWD1_61_31]|nr:MAG: 23S rRNA (guanosine(2251)-2'-O)-methyltransferase RlmB [Spirochaetes bacterium GWB1_60_80]OHD32799.1 MAG: 23S rRNA (guanosine(2251)-2'-O)-methyltransferase RlmB [Spirochaetes bacterium GWC1_61_12]OHD42495.1 MAG: 23S rRNA (guanosine(2251)-2'-O)-methyltransferase RlmB [Spirochaetes bacterium GWE1_60_18]OHD43182.1 MAG: 23S rRNA (guanosine(2251)-2'-O)-methyltransferase RlmB [Spirochaetes bacterium GWD1_61_31]OHD58223.1 MAG: 23S rRNA (guanosine(2251)-2'-O)-methyltransferase RlmB [Spirochaete